MPGPVLLFRVLDPVLSELLYGEELGFLAHPMHIPDGVAYSEIIPQRLYTTILNDCGRATDRIFYTRS
ncbi:hypothetical protein [Undibacterium macrobrachii]|uniref:hypothetical protein n=1 Tax=Undibacterium macrobrachii TaxID=1119058 RepID=UPI001674565D|nr:hypothetical protein [Undibacterium macrobrachii]